MVLINIGETKERMKLLVKASQNVPAQILGVTSPGTQTNAKQAVTGEGPLATGTQLPKPEVVLTPREGFYSQTVTVNLADAEGKLSGETISYYPPGIPFVGVGERITPAVLAYIKERQVMGFVPNGCADKTLKTIRVISEA